LRLFADRVDAGRRLAKALRDCKEKNTIILAIPRGGVVVGFEVANELNVPLDVIIPRKIGAPGNPELAIGAVMEDGTIIMNEELTGFLQVSEDYIKEESGSQRLEIERRLKFYRRDAPYPDLKNRVVIMVDDGIATGSTMKAAVASIRKKGARAVVIAVPVGPPSTVEELKKEADHVICLQSPDSFMAIGQFYENFNQTSDKEVIRLLKLNRDKQASLKAVSGDK
jgi:predicted phosphoribosyltransferase